MDLANKETKDEIAAGLKGVQEPLTTMEAEWTINADATIITTRSVGFRRFSFF